MVLSKRWQFLWMMVPKLFYDDSYQDIKYETFLRFVDRAADKWYVRQLIIEFDSSSRPYPAILPRSLYTGCRMLVTLKLNDVILVDVDSVVSFPSLVTLDLISVKYPGDEFVKRVLSNCPFLEALDVERADDDNVTIFTVNMPSLKTLFLCLSPEIVHTGGFVIDAPALELFDIVDHASEFCIFENNMPNIVEANVDILFCHPGKILSSITSVKQLYLCSQIPKDAYPLGCVFLRLVHLEICTRETEWLNLLMRLLRDSLKLKSLKLEQCHPLRDEDPRPCWIKPSSVPESMLSSLETLEWIEYEGSKEEKELVAFILRTGSNLKNVTISSLSTERDKKLEMLKELALLSRRSPICELAFN